MKIYIILLVSILILICVFIKTQSELEEYMKLERSAFKCRDCNEWLFIATKTVPERNGIYCPLCGDYNTNAWDYRKNKNVNNLVKIMSKVL